MIKFVLGDITNPKTNQTKEIIVKALAPNNIKQTLIGGGLILAGVIYLTSTSFKNGAKAFSNAEYNTLKDLDLIN